MPSSPLKRDLRDGFPKFKQIAVEMAVIEQAGLDLHRRLAAQMLLSARNLVRDQTAIEKPFVDWTLQDIIRAAKEC
jgi:hypothetical protein